MIVCIAEKPSVAKDLAEVLHAKQRKDGYFEGNGYQVTWTFGHLCTLKEPHDYKPSWKSWNLYDLPMIPSHFGIKPIEDTGVKKQLAIIERLVSACEFVINCGDAGQEGELIQRWVLHYVKCKVPVKRLWISSLTEEAIREGFKKLRDGKDYVPLYQAGISRAVGDWMLGMNATRLFTLKFGNNDGVLSVGRVQTPTLAMIVKRQKEIEQFVPEDFWEVKTKYRDVEFSSELGKIKKLDMANQAIQEITDKLFEIVSFDVKEGKESAPRLFDLTSLQVEANKKMAYSAEDSLKLVQSLYEKKLVTYPRVDTTYLSDDLYPKIPDILKGIASMNPLTNDLLAKPIKKTKQIFDNTKVTDHHAIIPTGVTPNNVTKDESRIYMLIMNRFLAAFHPDCKVANTVVIGKVDVDSVKSIAFKATGKQILEPGWRVVYDYEKNQKQDDSQEDKDEQNQEEDEKLMPLFEAGESGPHEPKLETKKTSPPKPYTEATLLRAMETAGKQVDDDELRELLKDNGIGRPSTRANIIETLFRRKYIERKKKNIFATVKGVHLIDTISNELLKSPELTGEWEKKLRLIEKQQYDHELFKEELKQMVMDLTNEILSPRAFKIEKAIQEMGNLTCPKCKNGKVIRGNKAFGCTKYSSGCDFRIPLAIHNTEITAGIVGDLVLKKEVPLLKEQGMYKLLLNSSFALELVENSSELTNE
jgi:DNA topoisomerase-3